MKKSELRKLIKELVKEQASKRVRTISNPTAKQISDISGKSISERELDSYKQQIIKDFKDNKDTNEWKLICRRCPKSGSSKSGICLFGGCLSIKKLNKDNAQFGWTINF